VIARRPRGWRALRALVFLPYMISGAAVALVFTVVYNPRFGLLNAIFESLGLPGDTDWLFSGSTSRWAVAATFAFTIGFAAIVVSAEIASFPSELFEAAEIDGAGVLKQQLYLTLPLLRNVIGTLVLLSILGNLAAFDIVYILTNGGPADGTATLILYAYRAYIAGDWGLANAVGVVVVALGLVLILGVRRLFRIGEER
jgi:raffinose/stachyose/melibiose transport system permease protein